MDWWNEQTFQAAGGATPNWWMTAGKRNWYQHSLIGTNTGGNLGVPGGPDWWNRFLADATTSGALPTTWALIV